MSPSVPHRISGIGRIILQYLAENDSALDAESLWLELRKKGHSMSICAIYLNLKKLVRINHLDKIPSEERKFIYTLK